MKDAEVEKSILKEDSITNFIFQDMSPLSFLPLARVLTKNFRVDYVPNQGIKIAVKNLNQALLQYAALTKKQYQLHELTIFLKAMQTSHSHSPL